MERERFEILSATVLHLLQAVQEIKAKKMEEYGLRGRSASVLCRIYERGGALTAMELTKICEVDKAQISRALAELSAREFLEKAGDGTRCYKQKYTLTPGGARAAADISRAFADIEATVSKGLTKNELEIFFRTLYTLSDNFDALLLKYK